MNTAAFLSPMTYGYIEKSYGNDAPFISVIALMSIGKLPWLKIDPGRRSASPRAHSSAERVHTKLILLSLMRRRSWVVASLFLVGLLGAEPLAAATLFQEIST